METRKRYSQEVRERAPCTCRSEVSVVLSPRRLAAVFWWVLFRQFDVPGEQSFNSRHVRRIYIRESLKKVC